MENAGVVSAILESLGKALIGPPVIAMHPRVFHMLALSWNSIDLFFSLGLEEHPPPLNPSLISSYSLYNLPAFPL